MGTAKWNRTDNFVIDLKRFSSIEYNDSGCYELSHKNLKYDYKLTSKRMGT